MGATDARLSAFLFIPGVYDARYHEFRVNKPLPWTRWLHCGAADYDAELTLPEGYALASTGVARETGRADGRATWHIEAENVRELALCFGRRYRAFERKTDSGVTVRVLTNVRGAGARALDAAVRAIGQCEAWFGPFPVSEFEIAQSDYPLGALDFPGLVWLPEALLGAGKRTEMTQALRVCVARQYFGLSAYVEPSADAWLSDSVSAYVGYLLLEAAEGHEAFLKAVNRDWVSALQLTIPGGLNVTSDAALFDQKQYDIVVKIRGAAVLHELREAMGLEALLDGLERFYELGQDGHILSEGDFVDCMDAASGRSWRDFLTDWVFNVGDYVNQPIDFLQ